MCTKGCALGGLLTVLQYCASFVYGVQPGYGQVVDGMTCSELSNVIKEFIKHLSPEEAIHRKENGEARGAMVGYVDEDVRRSDFGGEIRDEHQSRQLTTAQIDDYTINKSNIDCSVRGIGRA